MTVTELVPSQLPDPAARPDRLDEILAAHDAAAAQVQSEAAAHLAAIGTEHEVFSPEAQAAGVRHAEYVTARDAYKEAHPPITRRHIMSSVAAADTAGKEAAAAHEQKVQDEIALMRQERTEAAAREKRQDELSQLVFNDHWDNRTLELFNEEFEAARRTGDWEFFDHNFSVLTPQQRAELTAYHDNGGKVPAAPTAPINSPSGPDPDPGPPQVPVYPVAGPPRAQHAPADAGPVVAPVAPPAASAPRRAEPLVPPANNAGPAPSTPPAAPPPAMAGQGMEDAPRTGNGYAGTGTPLFAAFPAPEAGVRREDNPFMGLRIAELHQIDPDLLTEEQSLQYSHAYAVAAFAEGDFFTRQGWLGEPDTAARRVHSGKGASVLPPSAQKPEATSVEERGGKLLRDWLGKVAAVGVVAAAASILSGTSHHGSSPSAVARPSSPIASAPGAPVRPQPPTGPETNPGQPARPEFVALHPGGIIQDIARTRVGLTNRRDNQLTLDEMRRLKEETDRIRVLNGLSEHETATRAWRSIRVV